MDTTRTHLTLVTARRSTGRRRMPAHFLGRPADLYRARYRRPAAPEVPHAA